MLERMHDPTKYRFFGAHSNNEESPPVFPRPNAKGIDSTAPQGIILALLGDTCEPSQDAGLFALQILLLSASDVVKNLVEPRRVFEHKGSLDCASSSLNDWPLSQRRCIISCLWLLETHVVECWMPGLRFQVEGLRLQGCAFCEPFFSS